MDLQTLRREIDRCDKALLDAFLDRMAVSARIGAYKKAQGLPVLDPKREEEKLAALTAAVDEEMAPFVRALYETLFALSRKYQEG